MPLSQAHAIGAIHPIPDLLRHGLTSIYRDLDRALTELGATCDACGRCCHLVKWGHQLWLTNIELSLLVTDLGLRRPAQKGVCPYLTPNRTCGARSARALGCRIFHCQLPAPALEKLHEQFLDRISELARAHRVDLLYAELLDSLESLSGGGSSQRRRNVP